MSSALNKRQQARNERILQDLSKLPGNDRCADCSARNPAWASWSLGVFLCIRCASLHRKLGTHVSKVKSISMDSWSNDQIECMRKNGNQKSNAYYNPDASKHPVPVASEDIDSQMERYIRAKYEYQSFRRDSTGQSSSSSSHSSGASTISYGASITPTNTTTHHTGASSSSSNASFPSAPSRTVKRSVSTGFPGRRLSIGLFRSSSPSGAKVSQILGATPYTDSGHIQKPEPVTASPKSIVFPHGMVTLSPTEKYAEQLRNLRDMGFNDTTKSVEVLESTGGKILDTVEILIRLGRNEEQRPTVPPKPRAKSAGNSAAAFGISITKDPFAELDKEEPPLPPLPAGAVPHQPQQIQRAVTGTGYGPWNGTQQMNGNGYQDVSPFGMDGLQQTLPNLHTSMPQQASNPYSTMPQSANPYAGHQPSTNPYAIRPQHTSSNPYSQPIQQFSPMNTGQSQGYNPFLTSSPTPVQQNSYPAPPPSAPLPRTQTQWQMQQQPAQQLQANPFLSLQSQPLNQSQGQFGGGNPYLQTQQVPQNYSAAPFTAPASQLSFGQDQNQLQQPWGNPQGSLQQQRTGSVDKRDILALYNAPHLAPAPNPNPQTVEQNKPPPPTSPPVPVVNQAGSNNPFLPGAAPAITGNGAAMGGIGTGGRHMSKESVDFGGWQSGRHSPDAFASLAFGGR